MGSSAEMRAVILEKAEGRPGKVYHPVEVKTVPMPQLQNKTDVLVRIDYAALNHRDLFIRRSLYPGITFPSILGADAVGTVIEPSSSPLCNKRVLIAPAENWLSSPDGPDVAGKTFGILGGVKQTNARGTFADYIAVASDHVVALPPHLDDQLAAAAAIPLGGLTAYRATFTKARVKRGQNILITGIGGGVAVQALQYCVAAGASVWVTSGSEEKIEKAKELGAKGGVSYKEGDWPQQLKALLPKDKAYLDAVIDSGGGPIVGQTTLLLKEGGIIACYGSTTQEDLSIGMVTILKNIEFKGSTMGSLEEFREAVAFIGEHKIVPIVHTVLPSLERIEEGFQLMDAGSQFGKICVQVAAEAGKGKL